MAAAEPRSAWLSVECVAAEQAVVAFATVRLAADIEADIGIVAAQPGRQALDSRCD